jgi:hypothetical protein
VSASSARQARATSNVGCDDAAMERFDEACSPIGPTLSQQPHDAAILASLHPSAVTT